MSEKTKTLTYRFRWPDGRERQFTVRLSYPEMRLEAGAAQELPDWTRLEFHQCDGCPLRPAESPRCPTAASLVELADFFKDCLSTEVVEAAVEDESREYRKTVPIQVALSSLMGLYMATSGCPILDKLRPMASLHLPFATLAEGVYRGLSMYLVAQLLKRRRGQEADEGLDGLKALFRQIAAVNQSFSRRLAAVAREDASLNALVKLDCLAGFASFVLDDRYLAELERMFAPYLA